MAIDGKAKGEAENETKPINVKRALLCLSAGSVILACHHE
jgi:hypothetical protein